MKEKHQEVSFLLFSQWIVLGCGAFLSIFFVEPRVVAAFLIGGASYVIPHMIATRWYFHYRGAMQTHYMLMALWGGQVLKWVGVGIGMWFGMQSSIKATLLGLFMVNATYWCLPWARTWGKAS